MFATLKNLLTGPRVKLDGASPDGASAVDLLNEWHNATYHNFLSQIGAKRRAESYTRDFLEQDPAEDYTKPESQRYESIFPLLTDKQNASQAPENRPCQDQHSQLHRLDCGHFIFFKDGRDCGINCEVVNVPGTYIPCVLCFRIRLRQQHHFIRPKRWHDLLLPTFIDPTKESAEFTKNTQMGEPAFLDSRGFIILPRNHYMIAMVRAIEIREERLLIDKITQACASRAQKVVDVGPIALEFFDHMLIFHHELKMLDMPAAAGLAIMLALEVRQNTSGNFDMILGSFGVLNSHQVASALHVAQNNIYDWAAQVVLVSILLKLPRSLGVTAKRFAIQTIALRIWNRMSEHGILSKAVRWNDRARIMACCVEQAIKYHRATMSYEGILELINVRPHGIIDATICSTMGRFMAGTDWSEDVGPIRARGSGGLTAEGTIHREHRLGVSLSTLNKR